MSNEQSLYCAMDLHPILECGLDCRVCNHRRYTHHFEHRNIRPCWVCERDTVQEYDPTDQLYYCQKCGAPQVK